MTSESRIVKLTLPVGDRDRSLGLATAPATLVEYGDYECSNCGRAHLVIKDIQKWLRNYMRFVFRNFPLTEVHPHAQQAAEAAEAAAAQGKFWEMHDHLFEHQGALDDVALAHYAVQLSLDPERFNREITEHTHAKRVHEDLLSGAASGVKETPTFFINGVYYKGSWDLDDLLGVLEQSGIDRGI